MLRHKFNAKPEHTEDGYFSSQKELRYWQTLKLALKAGELIMVLRQVPFHLPGGVRYVVDFCEFWKGGDIRFVEVKGHKTESYRAKRRIVEATYPIKIVEV